MKRWPLPVRVAALCLLFSILGYVLGCFMHSEFFHFFSDLFGALQGGAHLTIFQVSFIVLGGWIGRFQPSKTLIVVGVK